MINTILRITDNSKVKFVLAKYLILLLFNFPFIINGQDFHISQYYASPLTLNPAMTGAFIGQYRIVGNYRAQWGSLTNPFSTTAISFDMRFSKFSAGASLINNRAGLGHLNVLNFAISGVYDIILGSSGYHHVLVGSQLGVLHKSIDLNKLSFDNQFNYSGGGGYDRGVFSGEFFPNTATTMADINLGLLWFYAKNNTKINPFTGISILHISEPNESFFGNTSILPRRYIVHSGFKVNAHELFQFAPQVLYMKQGSAQEIAFGLLTYHYLVESDAFFIAGLSYRNKDAVIVDIGLKNNKFTYRISYDINTSSLYNVSRGMGAFEFSIQYIGISLPANPKYGCPRL